jgi:hypothetical protein
MMNGEEEVDRPQPRTVGARVAREAAAVCLSSVCVGSVWWGGNVFVAAVAVAMCAAMLRFE